MSVELDQNKARVVRGKVAALQELGIEATPHYTNSQPDGRILIDPDHLLSWLQGHVIFRETVTPRC